MNTLFEILDPHFVLRNALYSSVLIGLLAPPIGAYVVLGRRTLLALTLPQISTFGVASVVWIAGLLGFHLVSLDAAGTFIFWALAGSSLAMILGLGWQQFVQARWRTPADAEAGAGYALATALTLALAAGRYVPELGLLERLKGDVLAVPNSLLICEAVGLSLILGTLMLLARPLESLLFDPIFCRTSGLPAAFLNALTLLLIGGVVALGGLCAGPLTVFAFLVMPSLTAQPIVRNMTGLYWLSAAIGGVCAFAGFWLSYSWESLNLPIAAAQITCLGSVWIVFRLIPSFRRDPGPGIGRKAQLSG